MALPKWENIDWADFKKLSGLFFTPPDFAETLDGGQAFRWHKISNKHNAPAHGEVGKFPLKISGLAAMPLPEIAPAPPFQGGRVGDGSSGPEYFGVFGRYAVRARLAKNGTVEVSFPRGADSKKYTAAIKNYFDCTRDYSALRGKLNLLQDPHLCRALEAYPTLRILRQPASEAVVSFICSSSKRIVQIKQCVELLAQRLGEKIADGIFALPTFDAIAAAPIEEISACKLGFRADYLKRAAQKIVLDKFEAESLRDMPYREAKKYLLSLRGVGEKIADCILLFGAARFQAFPVDTWIRQAMTKLYSTPNSPDAIRDFAARKFAGNAGFAQQLIFANIRNSSKQSAPKKRQK